MGEVEEKISKIQELITKGKFDEIKEEDTLLAITFTDQMIEKLWVDVINLEKKINILKNELNYLAKVKEYLTTKYSPEEGRGGEIEER